MFSILKATRRFSPRSNIFYQSSKKLSISQRPYVAFSQFYYSVQVENRIEDKLLSLKWDDGEIRNYPHYYLRDQCPSCYNPQTRQRINSNLVLSNYAKTTIKTAHIDQDSDELHVEWMDDGSYTSSRYRLDWLKTHQFVSPTDNKQFRMKRRLWDSNAELNVPRFDFNKVLSDKLELYEWLRSILQNGSAIIDNMPKKIGQIQRVTQQVTDIRQTAYG